MTPINSKLKGGAGEREFKKLLNNKFDVRYERTPCSGGLDIKGDIRKAYGSKPSILDRFHWEVKRVEKINVGKCMDQSRHDARGGQIPILAHRRNTDYWKITLEAEDFFNKLIEMEEAINVREAGV